ncbi:MAG: EAL domain-containing response regulator [Stagnimonas sp.]|nr:EAL domain-containing response regulator [Stagnimonas sp.]
MSAIRSALVVDDDEFVRDSLARQIRNLGARVWMAADGDAARQALREPGQFDLVVCDLKMPGVDGVELLRDLGELQPEAYLILISSVDAKTLQSVAELALSRKLRLLGALQKPVTAAAFRQLLAKVGERPSSLMGGEPPLPLSVAEVRAAIETGEIGVYVQPKLDLRRGEITGVEALARWLRPNGEVWLPGRFMPIIERNQLLEPLTRRVAQQAFAVAGDWLKAGLRIQMSINVPIECLDSLDLPERLTVEAAAAGLPHSQITLELTESGLMTDLTRSLDVVTRLRLRGFELSIDDFGTGYSSLDQLRRFPFTELKIDRAFVNGAARNPSLRSIAESSIHLARDLGLKTCAEGVETIEDWELMRELGCTLIQGFCLSTAMPPEQLPGWIAARASAWNLSVPTKAPDPGAEELEALLRAADRGLVPATNRVA